MTKIKVRQFERWDQVSGEMRISHQMATLRTIKHIGCEPLVGGVEAEIDPAFLDGNGLIPISSPLFAW
jgi:hypothetical protein